MREMRVKEVTQEVGPSAFTPQYLGRFGQWKDYHRWDVRIGQNVTAEYYNLPEAQQFLEEQQFTRTTRIHPPFSHPQPNPRPKPSPRNRHPCHDPILADAIRRNRPPKPTPPATEAVRDNKTKVTSCDKCNYLVVSDNFEHSCERPTFSSWEDGIERLAPCPLGDE